MASRNLGEAYRNQATKEAFRMVVRVAFRRAATVACRSLVEELVRKLPSGSPSLLSFVSLQLVQALGS